MEFEWHELKRLKVLADRGLDFADADLLFSRPCLVEAAATKDDETRWIAVGAMSGVVVAAIYTMRGTVVRIITMRKARDAEKKRYQALLDG